MININTISKSYGRLPVLREVSMNFAPGRCTALLGPNGSGKTTLIKSILGLVRADSGDVLVNAINVSSNWSYRSLIGYMPQIARYPDNLSVQELLDMIAQVRQEEALRMQELIDVFELRAHLDKSMKSLSGGTRQKVSAVAALMFDVPVLILDEPTAGLDPLMARRLKDVIQVEKSKGRTIILTTHILAEIEELADDIAFLLEGQLLFHGTREELLSVTGQTQFERAVAALQELPSLRRAA